MKKLPVFLFAFSFTCLLGIAAFAQRDGKAKVANDSACPKTMQDIAVPNLMPAEACHNNIAKKIEDCKVMIITQSEGGCNRIRPFLSIN